MSRVVRQKKKALTTMEELEKDASADLGPNFTYSRNLLTEMKLGSGKHYKEVKEILEDMPEKRERYRKQMHVEQTMKGLKSMMMYAKEADSRKKCPQTVSAGQSKNTDPMGTGVMPYVYPNTMPAAP
mmetsp:Transcript_152991/g.267366  ORF Transcript_152991/g.267366 Transcript_152991/m.267366 type:complete len:127 (-) Transcript_152991:558-938(-)